MLAPGMKEGFKSMEKRLGTKGPIASAASKSRNAKTTWNKSGKKNFGKAN